MSSSTTPIVAIVGRPNVGKSTLFNRFAGRRRALVDNAPGLTRDRIAEEVAVGDRRVLLVDTAGLDRDAAEGTEAAVQAQARAAVQDADAILFVVDSSAGLLPEDDAIARTLRRASKPLLLAVNKVDVPAHQVRLAEFHKLGLKCVRALSAEHGVGVWEVLEELVAALPPVPDEAPDSAPEEAHRVALVGRPNVGKSSLLNRLVGAERVVVSSEPGTTRDAIDTRVERDGEPFVFVDTAGLRRAARRTRFGESGGALMTVRALERAAVALIVVDAAEGVTEQDARIAALARERGCATAVLVNKWDLIAQREEGGQPVLDEIARRMRFMSDAPVLRVSAKTGSRVERIFPLVREIARAAEQRIPTAALNAWLQDAVGRHEPSMAQRGPRKRPIKFFYATQTGVRPLTFVLFCTEPEAVQPSYRRFLENRLREAFGLRGTPVRLRLRRRNKADSKR